MPPRASVVEKPPPPPEKQPLRVLAKGKRANAEPQESHASDVEMHVDMRSDVSEDFSDDDASSRESSPTPYTIQHNTGKPKKRPAASTAHTITHIAADGTPAPSAIKRLRHITSDDSSTPLTTGSLATSIDQLNHNLNTAADMFRHADAATNARITKAFCIMDKDRSMIRAIHDILCRLAPYTPPAPILNLPPHGKKQCLPRPSSSPVLPPTPPKQAPKPSHPQRKIPPTPNDIIIPCPDPRSFPDSSKTAVGVAVNDALRKTNAPESVSISMVKKNINGNLILTPSPQTTPADITPHLPLILEAARNVHPALLPPRINEKWYKLAVHGVPIDFFPDAAEGMQSLQAEIEHNHPVRLID
ncbi:hypothetical protein FPQ18DRAFT_418770 [Pyronema domesticum]|nr:hypothetical protein FPQ18DRAFT_418770 [Pyronema domesticum]